MTQGSLVPWLENNSHPEKVLVVDDVAEVRSLCLELARDLGLEAAAVSDSSEAKDLLAKETFSLVISDIAMPDTDGLQLTRFIKKRYPHIDVILMTAFNMRYSYDDVLAAGAVDFIQKPFSNEELQAKLKRALGERRQLQTIQRSEEHFRTLLENIPGVVFTILADGTVRFVDNKVKELTGFPAEAFAAGSDPWQPSGSSDTGSLASDLLQAVLEQKGSVVREYLITTAAGQQKWLQVRGQPVFDDQGKIDHISGILLDISRQKRLEERTSALNRLFFSFGPDHYANIRKIVGETCSLMSASLSIYLRKGRAGERVSLILAAADVGLEERQDLSGEMGPLLRKILCASSEQPEILDNLHQDGELQQDVLVSRYQLAGCVAKPLSVSGRVRGAFCAAYNSDRQVSADETALFSMLAKALEIEEERFELQEALICSEEKYRSLVEGNLYPISIIDSDGAICYCNKIMASLFRCGQPAALLGRDFLELIHPGDRQRLAEVLRDLNQEGGVVRGQSLDFRALAYDGNVLDIRITLGPISFDGRPALQAILEDVTQRKQTEEALKDSEERYRTLVEGANDAVFLETFDGHIADVNTRACQMLGYSRDELLRLNMAEVVRQPDAPASEAEAGQGQNLHREETMVRKDGSLVPVEVNTSILKLKGQNYLMSVVRDITLRREKELRQKQLEQAIIESKNRLMAVFDGIMSPLTITDLDYNIIMVNKATASLFGEAIPRLLGRKCYEAFRKSDAPCRHCPVRETIRTGRPSHRLGANPIINRTIEEYTYPIFDASGNLSLIINYGIDVTDKIRMEKQLIQADKMASLGTLAAGIAHEIRNPMATINLNTQILMRDLELGEEHQVYLADIQKEIKKIERIISEILEFSKPKPAHLVETSINEVVQSVHELTRVQLRKHNVKVHFKLDDSLPAVLIDPAQIAQVLINLVINAMQAMPQGGDLTITTRQDPASKRVELLVRDTGVGIAPENLENIFDPFFTNKPEGTGLGLAIARQILHKNQATIQVSSVEKKGTVFRIQFKTLEE